MKSSSIRLLAHLQRTFYLNNSNLFRSRLFLIDEVKMYVSTWLVDYVGLIRLSVQ